MALVLKKDMWCIYMTFPSLRPLSIKPNLIFLGTIKIEKWEECLHAKWCGAVRPTPGWV